MRRRKKRGIRTRTNRKRLPPKGVGTCKQRPSAGELPLRRETDATCAIESSCPVYLAHKELARLARDKRFGASGVKGLGQSRAVPNHGCRIPIGAMAGTPQCWKE